MANLTQKKQDNGDKTKTQSGFSSDVVLMPFNQLVQDPDNVRKTRSELGIKELADNIQSEGLLQNLIVRKVGDKQFAVTGGERRRQALELLVKDGHIKSTSKIPCQLVEGNGVSASLSENIHRVAMNPADQSVAFVQLKESGLSIKEISLRHGLSVRQVEQRLALGRLSPKLLEALRSEKITLEEASAYTLTDDHKKQEQVFSTLGKGQSCYWIKKYLTDGELPDSDPLVKFVGREVYEAKGGVIRTDLFEDTVYLTQPELVMSLATAMLESEAERLKNSEGWKWVECSLESVYTIASSYERLYPAGVLTAKQEKELSKINARIAEIEALEGDWEEDVAKEHDSLSERLCELEKRSEAFSEEQKANAGGFLSVCYDGTFDWLPGYVRSEDKPNDSDESNDGSDLPTDKVTAYSKALRSDISALRLEMMRAECLNNPALASDLLIFHLLRNLLTLSTSGCFEITSRKPDGKDTKSSQGDMGVYSGREAFDETVKGLPLAWLADKDIIKSFEAFRALDQSDKTALQGYIAVLTLNPQLNDEPYADPVLEHVLSLMDVNFADYWTPNAAFFSRLNKHQLSEIAQSEISEEFSQNYVNSKKVVFAEAISTHEKIQGWIPDCISIKQ
jgi:ParB family chromosome partitioning protein